MAIFQNVDWAVFGIKALQLLLSLSLLVVLHEGGHFLFSKLFKVRVEKFYMFFNPWFHLFSTRDKWFTRLFPHFEKNETEYGIGWIPLGGYVKIAGMVDESMDTEQLKQPAQPDEFRSQAVWKRFFIMVGGVLVNLITAFVIYSAIMFTWGEDRLPMRGFQYGFEFNATAEELGFRDGDVPVKVDGTEILGYTGALIRDFSNAKTITVLRDGKEVLIVMPEDGLNMLELTEMQPPFYAPCVPSVIDSVMPGTPAAEAGIVAKSRLLAVDGVEVSSWGGFDEVNYRRLDVLASGNCTHADSLRLRQITIVVQQPSAETPDTIALQLDKDYKMGVMRMNPKDFCKVKHIDYSLLTCIPAGIKYGWNTLTGYVNDLKYIPSKKGVQSVGSFFMIGSIFPDTWDWYKFWWMTAFLSIILAVMNILPIPGLDGGHVVLLIYEAITGKEPNEKAMEWIERIGLTLLILLMCVALGNDLFRVVLPNLGLG